MIVRMGSVKMTERVLITGAAGRIGVILRAGLRGIYPTLRVADQAPLGDAHDGEEICLLDIRDPASALAALKDVDCVVHLAAISDEDHWQRIWETNILGSFHVFEAARINRTRRFVFASSNHVVGFYERTRRLDATVPPRPDSRYGVSKSFGENLGRYYADKHGMSVACLRIGSFRERPTNTRELSTWLSPRDMIHLVRCAIEAPDFNFVVAYGVSANERSWWDNSGAAILSYRPLDNAETWVDRLDEGDAPLETVASRFQGGDTCEIEFSGEPAAIE
jgi:uronate dehydrogenase